MTIKECLAQLSAEDLAYVKEYCESIQPFEVEPSATYEFDGEFKDSEGERIGTEITLSGDFQINLNEDHTIDDMFCTCGAGGLCAHLAAMMFDMEERNILFFSSYLAQQDLNIRA